LAPSQVRCRATLLPEPSVHSRQSRRASTPPAASIDRYPERVTGSVRGLHHVSSPFPDGGQHLIRRFYGELLGLPEIEVPGTLDRRLVWFAAGEGLELHFFPGSGDLDSGRHLCLEAADLGAVRDSLSQGGFAPYEATPIPNRPRFFCRDPAGNLVEFTAIEGDYRER
jgi:catechol 2,3-dioxygenase-like lactoylglutathione lyase family enzyme